MTISDISLHTWYDIHIVLMCTIYITLYTTVQQQNNYTLDTVTLHRKELKTFIIYDKRNKENT